MEITDLPALKKLDEVLDLLVDLQSAAILSPLSGDNYYDDFERNCFATSVILTAYNKKHFNIDYNEMYMILDKLIQDKQVLQMHRGDELQNVKLSYKGKLTNELGGYYERYRKDNQAKVTSVVINYTIAISGSIAAIYYLLEIFKNYILPQCNCLYYTH
jgi:hypothetical protein